MLGVTTYQEVLRALGGALDREAAELDGADPNRLPHSLRIVEQPEQATVLVSVDEADRTLATSDVEALVIDSRARRGADHGTSGALTDLLRAVGYALDESRARSVEIEVRGDTMVVGFRASGAGGPRHTLSYAGAELAELRKAAAARRKGDPLRRVLVLHNGDGSTAPIRELLLAVSAVQDLPGFYAPAVASSAETPHAIIVHLGASERLSDGLETVRLLRGAPSTRGLPLLVVAAQGTELDPADAFEAGADDLLPEPFAPAQLRARLRTWLLRGSTASPLAD